MTKADKFKALTFIHLPFVDKLFNPGDEITREDFDAYEKAASETITDSEVTSADDTIKEFLKYGSISDDFDAPLHPDHVPADPSQPSLALLIEQAKDMVEKMQGSGQTPPQELVELSKTKHTSVQADERATGSEK